MSDISQDRDHWAYSFDKQYRSAWDTQHGNRPPVVSRIGNVVVITFADTALQIVGGVATWTPITTES